MKYARSSGLLAALVPLASAFPAHVFEAIKSDPELAARANQIWGRQEGADAATAVFEPIPIWDAEAQLIDVSEGSGNEFQAPDLSTDLRGPCPGLNAFANHGFLPHNGYASELTIAPWVSIVRCTDCFQPSLSSLM
jgi:hypothetical protein